MTDKTSKTRRKNEPSTADPALVEALRTVAGTLRHLRGALAQEAEAEAAAKAAPTGAPTAAPTGARASKQPVAPALPAEVSELDRVLDAIEDGIKRGAIPVEHK